MHYPPNYVPVSLDSYVKLPSGYESATITVRRSHDDFRFWQRWQIQIFCLNGKGWRHAINGTAVECDNRNINYLLEQMYEKEENEKMVEGFISAIAAYGSKEQTH